MQDRVAAAHKQISVLFSNVVEEIYDVTAKSVKGVKLRNQDTKALTNFDCDGNEKREYFCVVINFR